MQFNKSVTEFERANKVIPGGVNSPVRAFKSVHLNPVFISHGKGSRIFDIDGNEYIDFVSSWGPLILGHAYPKVVDAIREAAGLGTSYGAPTVIETEMAELIVSMVPSVDIVRMVNSGTEATMSAIRLARGYTRRDKIVKFEGNYHGHADSFLIKAGSGAITLGLPDSPGVTRGTAQDTLSVSYNDLDSVDTLFKQQGDTIAALIVEPVAGNMGVITPAEGFLRGLRDITSRYGALLIFDEVITGFRLAKGGAQEYYGITPDLTTLGKIIGGGLPVGAYGGRKEIMENLAPKGSVYQAGTLSGNPLAMAAGKAMITELKNNPDIYPELERKAAMLAAGIEANLAATGVKGILNRVGSMMTLFFTDEAKVDSFGTAMKSDAEKYAMYFRIALESGIYLAPSQYEAAFVSYMHTDEEINKAIRANLDALQQL